MRFGVSTASFYPMLTEKVVSLLASRGIPHCEVFFDTVSEIEPAYVRELRAAAAEGGVKIVSVHPFTSAFEPFMLFTNYDRRFHDGIEWHKRYFDAMNLLGASIFVFHGDRAQGVLPDEVYYERFAVLRDLGRQFGVTVAQENVERCKSRSLSFLEGMVRYLDGDVSFVFDNKQARRAGGDCMEFIDRLAPHICHVHISDYTEHCDCAAVSAQSAHITQILRKLKETGYDGAVMVELYRSMIENDEDIFTSYRNLCEIAL